MPLRPSDFSHMFPPADADDEEGVHPAARYYVVAGARTAPETFEDGEAGADADEETGLFRSVPLSFRALETLFRSMPRVRKALAAELADAMQDDPEGADAEVPMFPRNDGESEKAYGRRLLSQAWPIIWEKTARAAYETSHGFEQARKRGTRFRWDVRRMVLEKRENHPPRQVHKLTHAQAMSRLHNVYNHVLRKLPKQLRYTLVPMSRPRGGVDPLESAGTYGYVSLPLDDFSPERLSDSRWRPVPATQMGLQRSFGFRFVGQGGVPKLMGGSEVVIGDEGHEVDDLEGNNKEMEMSGGLVPELDVAAVATTEGSGDVSGGHAVAAQSFPRDFMKKLKKLAESESKSSPQNEVAEDHEEMVGDFVVRIGGKKEAKSKQSGAGAYESSTESESESGEVSIQIDDSSSSSESGSEFMSESEDDEDDNQFEDGSTGETSQKNSNEYTLPEVLFGLLAPKSGYGKQLPAPMLKGGGTGPDGSVAPSLLSNLSALENFARH